VDEWLKQTVTGRLEERHGSAVRHTSGSLRLWRSASEPWPPDRGALFIIYSDHVRRCHALLSAEDDGEAPILSLDAGHPVDHDAEPNRQHIVEPQLKLLEWNSHPSDTVVRTVNTDDVSASGECIDPVIGMMHAPGAAGIAWRMTAEDRATAMSPIAIGGGQSSACTEQDEPASG
jgi:hypothetical protein